MRTPVGLHGGHVARGTVGVAVVVALASVSGCAVIDAFAPTAYCQPSDPVVTPQRIAPGGELHVETAGKDDGVDCEPRMPARARYEVTISSEMPAGDPDEGHYSAPLGSLDPSSDGNAEGTFRIPDQLPVGEAELSLSLQGAETICEIDPSIGCAKNPFTMIDVVG